jgi:hypothetical protein
MRAGTGFDRSILRGPIRPPVEGEEVDGVGHSKGDVPLGIDALRESYSPRAGACAGRDGAIQLT